MKKVLYTTIFGNKDVVRQPRYINDDFDYVLFCDQHTFESQQNMIKESVWEYRIMSASDNPRMDAKEFKINSHIYLKDYDLSIYTDGSFQQTGDLNDLVELMQNDFLVCKHPFKICLYHEAAACIRMEFDDPNIINAQIKNYRELNYPVNNGLLMGGILIRKNTEKVRAFNIKWWEEICNYSIRDQISFTYVKWLLNMDVDTMDLETTQPILKHYPHKI